MTVARLLSQLRLLGLQKGHESAKGELNKVAASSEAIDWAYFNGAIGQDDVVAEIKSAFDSVKLPDAKDTTLVEHPAWDADEFDKLALALQGENAEIASKSAKLTAYLGYMDNLPAVTEMTVDDVLSKDATLDEKIHRELNSLEVRARATGLDSRCGLRAAPQPAGCRLPLRWERPREGGGSSRGRAGSALAAGAAGGHSGCPAGHAHREAATGGGPLREELAGKC